MERHRLLPDFVLSNGDGSARPFHELLTDFNIVAIRRVPVPSHGPATQLLSSLLAENRGVEDVTVRGFDIRSPDRFCDRADGPHIVFHGQDLVTICDSDCSICRQFDVVGDERFFVIRSDGHVIDTGSIREIDRFGIQLGLDGCSTHHPIARAPPDLNRASRKETAA